MASICTVRYVALYGDQEKRLTFFPVLVVGSLPLCEGSPHPVVEGVGFGVVEDQLYHVLEVFGRVREKAAHLACFFHRLEELRLFTVG